MSALKEGIPGALQHAGEAIAAADTPTEAKAKLIAAVTALGGSPVPKIVEIYKSLAADVGTLEGEALLALMAAAKLISDSQWYGLGDEATTLYYANESRLPAPPAPVAPPTPPAPVMP